MIFSRKKKRNVPTRRLSSSEPRGGLEQTDQWRRNRTLSGVHKHVDPADSARAKAHDLTRRRRRVSSILLLVLAVIIVLTLLITQLTARVIIAGSTAALTTPIDTGRYEKVINDYLGIHPAARLRFLLSENDLSTYATGITPEVDHIAQTSGGNVTDTRFAITFRKPVAGWQINGNQYYVDAQGVVFQKNYYATPGVQIVDESGVSPTEGSTVASARFLSFVGRVVALSAQSGLVVTQAILPSDTTRELEIKLQGTPTLVKLSIDRGAGEQVEDMARALHYLSTQGQTPTYIDVRISGRAAYQ